MSLDKRLDKNDVFFLIFNKKYNYIILQLLYKFNFNTFMIVLDENILKSIVCLQIVLFRW